MAQELLLGFARCGGLRVTLGEWATPVVDFPVLGALNGLMEDGGALLVKDEGRLPTGSFKARGP